MVRHKNRYILVEVTPKSKTFLLKQGTLFNAINNEIQFLFGDFGVAVTKSGLCIMYCNEITRIALIRGRHGPHKMVASAVSSMQNLDKEKVIIRTLYTGATIKQCYKFLTFYQQKKFEQFCMKLDTVKEKKILKDAIMNFAK